MEKAHAHLRRTRLSNNQINNHLIDTEPRKGLCTQWVDREDRAQKEGGGGQMFRAVVKGLSTKQGIGGGN